MSTPERHEFGVLLAAHAGRSLTKLESARLRELAAAEAELAEEVASIDALHDRLDAERRLFEAVNTPLSPHEESDEGFGRLGSTAARAESELRAKLLHLSSSPAAMPRSDASRHTLGRFGRPRFLVSCAVAAALICAVALALRGSDVDRPALFGGNPSSAVLGAGARIVLQTELRSAHPELSWHAVVGASRYDATIEDARGQTVFVRPGDRARTIVWELTPDQVATLRTLRDRGDEPRLRIVAFDGANLPIATSGDLPLRLVD